MFNIIASVNPGINLRDKELKKKKKKTNHSTVGSKETFVEEVGFPVVFEVGAGAWEARGPALSDLQRDG